MASFATALHTAAGDPIEIDPTRCENAGVAIVLFDAAGADLDEVLTRCLDMHAALRLAIAIGPARVPNAATWRILGAGADDVFVCADLPSAATLVAERVERFHSVTELVRSAAVTELLVGASDAWMSVLRRIVEAAHFTAGSVLITGETGTGKEGVARVVHELDARPGKGRFYPVDCASIVPTLAGSELFGHERGAFTGAVAARDGAFAIADGGTLFLDEIGELPLDLQAELLRVLQERVYKRVGSNTWRATDFRLVCATNRDLLEEVERGTFRRDLYYRIAGWTFRLPPLAERRDDIPALVEHFVREVRPTSPPPISEPVMELLSNRSYPGNIRDLRLLVQQIVARHVGSGAITPGAVPCESRPAAGTPCRTALPVIPVAECGFHLEAAVREALDAGASLREIKEAAADAAIRVAEDLEGSTRGAALRLGITDRAIQMRRAVKSSATAA